MNKKGGEIFEVPLINLKKKGENSKISAADTPLETWTKNIYSQARHPPGR